MEKETTGKNKKILWNLIPGCVVVCIWEERNKRCSEDVKAQTGTLQRLKIFFGMHFTGSMGS